MLKIETMFGRRQEIGNQRLEICKVCEYYKDKHCGKCLCYMPAKVLLPFVNCPLNKWDSYKENKDG